MNGTLLTHMTDRELLNALMIKCAVEAEAILYRLDDLRDKNSDLVFDLECSHDDLVDANSAIQERDRKIAELQNIITQLQKDLEQ
ncbi:MULTISPECIES: hypothetical protein [unclassified Hahella]|uniref:hypothetical protein n=2 Tax=Hahella TaxID=158481 RepID=UPI001C1EF3C9|nr:MULTISPECIES: hypothetical protein [unclassified Hahella]MBU6955991.1 hypothetical protein [Hahella sp. HN01]MDG9671850.1 hypothetical protein [Hahella sp. CR1]WLQ15612.1 hypothetical protein O5O45_06745 [Hahella sp. HNIBRBA332]